MKLIRIAILASLLAGCASEPVAKDINQQQANEIVALLNSQGISATAQKESGAAGRYSVNVDSSALTPAIALLNDRGLPRKSRFAELIQPQGLIPNSREMEALRVDYARATEIEELLESHPAVSSAAVTLSRGDLGQEGASGVAVIVNQRSGRAISHAEVSEIVSRLIPGIKPENIALSIHAVDANGNLFNVEGAVNQGGKVIRMPLVPFLFGWRVAEDDFSALALAVLSLLLVVALLAAFLGYSYGAYRSGASDFRVSLPEPAVKSGRLDRPNPELPEE